MPKPVIATINNFMHSPLTEEDFDPIKIAAMDCIPSVEVENRKLVIGDRRQDSRRETI